MEKLIDLLERAVLVAKSRDGDIDTEDGTFATVDTDHLINLESEIQEFFGLEPHEFVKCANPRRFIEKKVIDAIPTTVKIDTVNGDFTFNN